MSIFFFNDTATTEIYTLSLHDALPICDVTDQKRTEAQLQQAEKLTAMGQLVSGVAHEINNPAAIISGFAQTLLLDDLKPRSEEHTSELQSQSNLVCRLLLEKKKHTSTA